MPRAAPPRCAAPAARRRSAAAGSRSPRISRAPRKDIPADLIVSGAIGQAVGFRRLEALRQRQQGAAADRNYQVQGRAGVFAGGDGPSRTCSPPRSATAPSPPTASTVPAGEPLDKRPKIDVHTWDLKRKLVEGRAVEVRGFPRRTDHPPRVFFDNRSDRYVIPHDELFLGHFSTRRATSASSRT